MKLALILAGLVLVAASALPLARKNAWWIRIFDFPRLQIAFLLAAVLAGYLLVEDAIGLAGMAFAGALAASLLYQGAMMYPYTVLARPQVPNSARPAPGSSVALMFVNVQMKNRNARRLREIIRDTDPDILLAVETDEWWREQLQSLRSTHPAALEHPLDNTYGMLLYSRLELVAPQVKFLVQDDVPSMHARVRLACGAQVELRCLHPRPPAPPEAGSSTPRDVELLVVGKQLGGSAVPAVVIGDLNDVAWSRTSYRFQAVSGLLDPRVGRGFYATFHAKLPFVRFPLDHCLHSRHFRLLDFRRLPRFGSDHFPVCVRLSYEPVDSTP